MKSSTTKSFKISIESDYSNDIDQAAYSIEKSFSEFMLFIRKALNEVDEIRKTFVGQTAGSCYISNKFIQDYDFFGGVWFETEFLEFNMVSFSEEDGQRWNITLKDRGLDEDLVSFFYDTSRLKNTKIDDGLTVLHGILTEIVSTKFLDGKTTFKMTF